MRVPWHVITKVSASQILKLYNTKITLAKIVRTILKLAKFFLCKFKINN